MSIHEFFQNLKNKHIHLICFTYATFLSTYNLARSQEFKDLSSFFYRNQNELHKMDDKELGHKAEKLGRMVGGLGIAKFIRTYFFTYLGLKMFRFLSKRSKKENKVEIELVYDNEKQKYVEKTNAEFTKHNS